MRHDLSFQNLVKTFQDNHNRLAANAVKAVNVSLTMRNWLIVGHTRGYGLNGSNLASYGEMFLDKLAALLQKAEAEGELEMDL